MSQPVFSSNRFEHLDLVAQALDANKDGKIQVGIGKEVEASHGAPIQNGEEISVDGFAQMLEDRVRIFKENKSYVAYKKKNTSIQ